MVLETGICLVQCSWVVRNWGTLREAWGKGVSFDEFVAVGRCEVGGKVEGFGERRREGGPRDWSFAGVFAALNRRHGDCLMDAEMDAGKGAKLVTTSSATCSDESLVFQRPDPIFTPSDPPRRSGKDFHHESAPMANDEKLSRLDRDAKNEHDIRNKKGKDFEKQTGSKTPKTSPSRASDSSSRCSPDINDGEKGRRLQKEEEEEEEEKR